LISTGHRPALAGVLIDEANQLNQLNNFPQKSQFQCFLLDGDDKVISVGNPVLNPKIWDLYKQIITGKLSEKTMLKTTVELINREVKLENIQTGVKHSMTFKLKNAGNTALVISDVKTSCGCTSANWEKQPIEEDRTTTITAEITLEETGYFEKTISVYCNVENSPILLTVKGNTQL